MPLYTPAAATLQLPPSVGPTGSLWESDPRSIFNSSDSSILTSGQPFCVLGWFPKGFVVTSITFRSGSAGIVGPTHQLFFIADSTLHPLAFTADDGATAWPAEIFKTLAMVPGPYTIPASGQYYVGIMEANGTSNPSIRTSNLSPTTFTGAAAPLLAGASSSAGLTTAASFPAQLGALAVSGSRPYCYTS